MGDGAQGGSAERGAAWPQGALLTVLCATLLNWATDAVGARLSGRPPLFLYRLGERLDDFFAFILSFPPHTGTAPARWFADRVAASPWPAFPKLEGVAGLTGTGITHLFVPPLTTSYCLLTAALMRRVDPSLIFLGTLAMLAGYWLYLVRRFVPHAHALGVLVLGVVAYPTLTMVTRGNVYAGATALLIMHAMLLARAGERPVLSALLLAVAVNIRPNAGLFLLPLLAMQPDWRRALFAFAAGAAALFALSLAVAHRLYPDYTLTTFLAALAQYHRYMVEQVQGIGYGSSLYGGLALLFGPARWQEAAGGAVALAIVAGGAIAHWRRPLEAGPLLFLTMAAYTIGSAVLVDYHLIVFLLPIMLAEVTTPAARVATVASVLMLAPKNVATIGAWSVQLVLNPLILIVAATAVIVLAWRARREPRPALAIALA